MAGVVQGLSHEVTLDELIAGMRLGTQMRRLEDDGRMEAAAFRRVFDTTIKAVIDKGASAVAWTPYDGAERLFMRDQLRMLACLPGLIDLTPTEVGRQVAGVIGTWDDETGIALFTTCWGNEHEVARLQAVSRLLLNGVSYGEVCRALGVSSALVAKVSTFVSVAGIRARRDLDEAIDAVVDGADTVRKLADRLGWGRAKAERMLPAARASVAAVAEAVEAEGGWL